MPRTAASLHAHERRRMPTSVTDAGRIIAADEAKAEELGQPVNKVVGAVGVSRGSSELDQAVAEAGAAAF